MSWVYFFFFFAGCQLNKLDLFGWLWLFMHLPWCTNFRCNATNLRDTNRESILFANVISVDERAYKAQKDCGLFDIHIA